MRRFRPPLAALLLSLMAALPARPAGAQAPAPKPPALFPFVLPWDDSAPGTATDVSFLNARPAGVHGYVVAKGGHFVETDTGKRVRFLGTNFAARDAFPSHADAEKVAARVAKLGINLVRLHHMDNSDWGQDASIWDYAYKDRQHLSVAQMDKLDYLVAQFKKNGVYVNLNLHVSRQFSAADGFPPSVSQISTPFDKRVDEFDPRMIALQKNYARDLLTHVNPYTHLSYAADPAVAVVEINNENSLVGDPWAVSGAGLDTLPEPFRGELAGLWNAWLLKKYGTDANLQSAWTAGLTPTGPGLLSPASPWSLEHQGTSQASLNMGAPGVQADITQTDGTAWHVQVHQTGLGLRDGATYTVTFRAKADKARAVPLVAGVDQNDWHSVGLDASAALTPDWKTFSYVFTAHDTVPGHARLAFMLGDSTGTVFIDDLQIHPGADGAGLSPGESLAAKTVGIPVLALKVQHDDWIAFLAGTERGYAEEMRGYLKSTLHVHANLICSQISWGGLTGLSREANMDFADNHAYWQHPAFPHKPWDPVDWTIPNTPMVADLAAGNGGTLRDLAEYRVAGKPYTVSEYNHPAPNDYRAEALPELATFAAFQDWDAVYLFDYGTYGAGAQNDRINGYFGIGSDPAKTAFLPAAALMFRAGEVTTNPPNLAIPVAVVLTPAELSDRDASAAWHDHFGQPDCLVQQLSMDVVSNKKQIAPMSPSTMPAGVKHFFESATDSLIVIQSPLSVSRTASGARYTAVSSAAQSVIGYVGGQTITLGENMLTFPAFGNNFAAVTLTAMDQQPLGMSHRLLLTLAGKVENQNMGWNAGRTSVGDRWGNGPTVAEGIPATVVLSTAVARHVWALDGTGRRVREVPALYGFGTLRFSVGPQFRTLWYEVEGPGQ